MTRTLDGVDRAMADETPELRVQLTKRADGSVVFRCLRRDGSVTWQHHVDRRALFFAFHDLSHFGVETTLPVRRGFYGLLADGWDIADTEGKGAHGPLPDETIWVEHLVGLLDRERVGGGSPLSAAEVRAYLPQLAGAAAQLLEALISDERLTAARERIGELHGRWAAIPQGGTLELVFDRARSGH